MSRKNKSKSKKSKFIPKVKNRGSSLVGLNVSGKLDVNKSGMGFVIVENWNQDVLVYARDLNTAMNGDIVKVKITKVSSKGRPEGVINEVIKRSQSEFIGYIQMGEGFAFLVNDKSKSATDIFLPKDNLNGAKDGDKAIVTVVKWESGDKRPVGKVVEVLDGAKENDIVLKDILLENGFPIRFPEEVIQESEKLSEVIDDATIALRKDCRDILTFTIDPLDAKDFDDAISFRVLKNGNYEVGVHIADVSHYVKPGTALDAEAYNRATSVYLPGKVSPMLPEHISNVLCSLRPNEDKLTFSVLFQIDKNGKIQNSWIGRTVIHSDRRFTYEDAQEIIETGKGDYADVIQTLHTLTQTIRKDRFKKGAINFSSQEIRFELDEDGKPIGIVVKESKAAHQLIEELMLLANKQVAIYVGKKKINNQPIPFPYRVHDVPDESKLGIFAAFASRFGYKLNVNSPEKIAASFNELLKAVEGKPEQHVLEQLGIRTMAKAVYQTDNIGHYGLGFADYCHFTSPIRRYPDVMVHRIVQECLDETIVPDKKMEVKSLHCTERERKAMEAERSANKYKQVEFMLQFVGHEFDAVISGVSNFGFWAETVEHKCEGLVSLADLTAYDNFVYSESDYALKGLHTGLQFQIGDKVKILVAAANLQRRQIDFEYVNEKKLATNNTKKSKTKNEKEKKVKSTSKKKKEVK